MKQNIIFIDDEAQALEALQRMLRPMRDHWEMVFVKSGQEALTLMSKYAFDVIITDMRMAGMDGAELLTEVKKRHPQTIRFVLSGESDKESIFRTISPAHQYLSKPCDPATLKRAIEHALELHNLLNGENLKRLISQIRILPSPPSLYMKVVQALRSPDASLKDVGTIIERDLGMSTKVLQLVNSAFFGLPQRVSSPAQAVNLLGLETIRSLVLLFGVFTQFDSLKEMSSGLSIEALQLHSLTVGAFAQAIARMQNLDKRLVDDIYMAGLFHDLGKLILLSNMPQRYNQVLLLARTKNISLAKAEFTVLGATHAEVGAYLLGLWGFSDPIVEATALHHRPEATRQTGFTAVTAVHLANALAEEQATGMKSAQDSTLSMKYVKALGLDEKLVEWREACLKIGEKASAEQ